MAEDATATFNAQAEDKKWAQFKSKFSLYAKRTAHVLLLPIFFFATARFSFYALTSLFGMAFTSFALTGTFFLSLILSGVAAGLVTLGVHFFAKRFLGSQKNEKGIIVEYASNNKWLTVGKGITRFLLTGIFGFLGFGFGWGIGDTFGYALASLGTGAAGPGLSITFGLVFATVLSLTLAYMAYKLCASMLPLPGEKIVDYNHIPDVDPSDDKKAENELEKVFKKDRAIIKSARSEGEQQEEEQNSSPQERKRRRRKKKHNRTM